MKKMLFIVNPKSGSQAHTGPKGFRRCSIEADIKNERIVKEYIAGDTVYELVLKDKLPENCLCQMKSMCDLLYKAKTNIDYFPTNFILRDGILYYVDYECNDYMEEWNFENWGIKYWSKTPEFLKYVKEHSG